MRLRPVEREHLAHLADQVRRLLEDAHDPLLRRLFPPAYTDDPVEEASYQMLMGDDLLTSHLRGVETLVELASAERLEEVEAVAWLQAINVTRLVLGTRLGVTDEEQTVRIDEDDPDLPLWVAFDFLAGLLDELVRAMAASLPDDGDTFR